ncbi:uncharacterized protein LOC117339231 [Pecten maximus]|uniref:uncharacterized protein LOC117339231 n=1 Tax=Pecten maximus TaxID=6579 RepID=UPI00145838DE|nr:uncharacterized protein LOC117339231 [Pecten maximus]
MASYKSISFAQEPVGYTCVLCDSEDNVNWYCNDCQEALCNRCRECHTRGKKTKNDDVVPIEKADRQDDKPVPEVCKLHSGKLCDVYCCECDMLLCLQCFSQTHKHHNWKPLEDEFPVKKQQLQQHMTTISERIQHFRNEAADHVGKRFVENIDDIRKDVNSQRSKLKAEVDSIADEVLTELSALEKQESGKCKNHCKQSEKKVAELTSLLQKAEMACTPSVSMFETEKLVRTALPQYDANINTVLPKLSRFLTGSIDRAILTNMLGELHHDIAYEKIDIDSQHVRGLSKFTVPPHSPICDVCPVDHSQAWLSIHRYKGLVLVNREGVVTQTVKLDFCQGTIAMVGTTDILLTRDPPSVFVYKLSLHSKEVTTFADISPYRACDVSINRTGEVFVSTMTTAILVLNQSGTIVRKVICDMVKAVFITCLPSGRLGVVVRDETKKKELIIIDESGKVIHKWSGDLDNGQKGLGTYSFKISCDMYDRVFVQDPDNNQVYVIPSDGSMARCLLDKTHGVVSPTAARVDARGDVWIGCENGTVHVLQL